MSPSLAKVLLHRHNWELQDVIDNYRKDPNKLLVDSRVKPPRSQFKTMPSLVNSLSKPLAVCLRKVVIYSTYNSRSKIVKLTHIKAIEHSSIKK